MSQWIHKESVLGPFILFLLVLFSFALGVAQEFGQKSSEWYYDRPSQSTSGYTRIQTGEDTLVMGMDCVLLRKMSRVYSYSYNTYSDRHLRSDVIHVDAGLVSIYSRTREEFVPLMNFRATPGTSWNMQHEDFDHTITRTVIDTFQIELDSSLVRGFAAADSSWIFDHYIRVDTFLEGAGPKNGFYRPWSFFESMTDGFDEGLSLLCYKSDSYSIKNTQTDCNYLPPPLQLMSSESRWTYDSWSRANEVVSLFSGREYEVVGNSHLGTFRDLFYEYSSIDQSTGALLTRIDSLGISVEGPYSVGITAHYYIDWILQDTLYNLSASIGDVWDIKIPHSMAKVNCVVVDTMTMIMDGHMAQSWIIDYTHSETTQHYRDTVVQGVGNLHHHFLPWDHFLGDDRRVSGNLRCFVNEEITYIDPELEDCFPFTVSSRSIEKRDVLISPNPASHFLRIEQGSEQWRIYEIVSPTGQMFSGDISSNIITLPAIPVGLYFLRILNDRNQSHQMKFVKI